MNAESTMVAERKNESMKENKDRIIYYHERKKERNQKENKDNIIYYHEKKKERNFVPHNSGVCASLL